VNVVVSLYLSPHRSGDNVGDQLVLRMAPSYTRSRDMMRIGTEWVGHLGWAARRCFTDGGTMHVMPRPRHYRN